jgi:LytS/YehU family sensor histidine kinase
VHHPHPVNAYTTLLKSSIDKLDYIILKENKHALSLTVETQFVFNALNTLK